MTLNPENPEEFMSELTGAGTISLLFSGSAALCLIIFLIKAVRFYKFKEQSLDTVDEEAVKKASKAVTEYKCARTFFLAIALWQLVLTVVFPEQFASKFMIIFVGVALFILLLIKDLANISHIRNDNYTVHKGNFKEKTAVKNNSGKNRYRVIYHFNDMSNIMRVNVSEEDYRRAKENDNAYIITLGNSKKEFLSFYEIGKTAFFYEEQNEID